MFAVFENGPHQYRVAKGDIIDIEKIEGDEGKSVSFDRVMLVSADEKLKLGHPYVDGAHVSATIRRQFRDEKVLVFKYKRRKNFKKLKGHRQPKTTIEINEITC